MAGCGELRELHRIGRVQAVRPVAAADDDRRSSQPADERRAAGDRALDYLEHRGAGVSVTAEAYSVFRTFPASPRAEFLTDRHYLLYSAAGAMRLEADSKV